MTDSPVVPFYRSFLLDRVVYLDALHKLTIEELGMLNVDTLASLNESRHRYEQIEDKRSEEASAEYRRIKIAGYFQAGIRIELDNR